MKPVLQFFACAALFAVLGAPAHAQEVKAGDLVITQVWSRATPGGAKIAGGYLTIENKGAAPDRLIGGSGDFAGKVEIHEMAMNNGVMTMRSLDKGPADRAGQDRQARAGRLPPDADGSEDAAQAGRQGAAHARIREGRQGALSLDVQGVGARAPAAASGHDHSGMKK